MMRSVMVKCAPMRWMNRPETIKLSLQPKCRATSVQHIVMSVTVEKSWWLPKIIVKLFQWEWKLNCLVKGSSADICHGLMIPYNHCSIHGMGLIHPLIPCNCTFIKTHIVLLLMKFKCWFIQVKTKWLMLDDINVCQSSDISSICFLSFFGKTLNRSVCRRPSPVKCEVSKKRTFQSLL